MLQRWCANRLRSEACSLAAALQRCSASPGDVALACAAAQRIVRGARVSSRGVYARNSGAPVMARHLSPEQRFAASGRIDTSVLQPRERLREQGQAGPLLLLTTTGPLIGARASLWYPSAKTGAVQRRRRWRGRGHLLQGGERGEGDTRHDDLVELDLREDVREELERREEARRARHERDAKRDQRRCQNDLLASVLHASLRLDFFPAGVALAASRLSSSRLTPESGPCNCGTTIPSSTTRGGEAPPTTPSTATPLANGT